ncbi:MAG: PTS sugar transporter subunit IIA [Verrucomicrobiales bacterium]
MHLSTLITPNQIAPAMKAQNRWEALSELVELLVASGKISAASQSGVLDALRAREESMSTGIGLGNAIPHASSVHLNEVVVAFGRSKEGINFEALDNLPVQFVVMFVVPEGNFALHLKTLSAIAKILNEAGVREQLAKADDAEGIYDVLRRTAGHAQS